MGLSVLQKQKVRLVGSALGFAVFLSVN